MGDKVFCRNCGVKTPVERINWHYLVHQVQHGIFHVDGGIIYTIKELFTRPGHSIREYIEGKRARHFKPILMIMILGALVSLIQNYILGSEFVPMNELIKIDGATGDAAIQASLSNSDSNDIDSRKLLELVRASLEWVNRHFAIMTVVLIPLLAVGLRGAFRKYRATVNYPEWLVITCFLAAQALCIYALFLLIKAVFSGVPDIKIWLILAAQILTLTQYFRSSSWWKISLRVLLGYFYYCVLGLILIVIAAGVIIAMSLKI